MTDLVLLRHGKSRSRPSEPSSARRPSTVYRQRRPRTTSLDQLLDTHYEKLKASWEERFERR